MKNNKKILTIISVIIIFTVIVIAVISYMYFFTDTFKTNKQLFFKYIAQNSEVLDIIQSNEIERYSEKKKNEAFESNGELVTNISEKVAEKYIPSQNVFKELQNFKIVYDCRKDLPNNYEEATVSLQYSNGEKMSLEYLRQEDYYGLKIDNVLKKYIVVQNDNLKELAKKLQLSDTSSIPDKIKINNLTKYMLNEEELQNLKSKLYQVLDVNLEENKFLKTKEQDTMKYTLKLTIEEIEAILNTMYEVIINDENINAKLNKYLINEIGMDENEAKDEISKIKKAISEAKDNKNKLNMDSSEDDIETAESQNDSSIDISILVNNNKLAKTYINTIDRRMSLKTQSNKIIIKFEELKEDGDSKYFDEYAEITLDKEQTEDAVSYNIKGLNRKQNNQLEIVIDFNGLKDLSNINEKYSIIYKSNIDDNADLEYVLKRNVIFKDDFKKKKITEEGVKINNYEAEKLQTIMGKIADGLVELNKKKMETLGLKEDENPIFYIIPSSSTLNNLYTSFAESENKVISDSKITQLNKRRELIKEKITERISELRAKYYEDRIQNTTIAEQNLDEYIKNILVNGNGIQKLNDELKIYGYEVKFDESKGIICSSKDDEIILICKITNGKASWSEENKQ